MRLLLASLDLILLLNNHIVAVLKTSLLSVSRCIFVIASLFTLVGLISRSIDHVGSRALQAVSQLGGVHTSGTLRLPTGIPVIQVAQTV